MRSIHVSTDVFAAIWARRQSGEDSEDAILKREFGCLSATNSNASVPDAAAQLGGVRDTRNGVRFPEGFRIFRNYKGREFIAEAKAGSWVRLDDGSSYPTLNQLNSSIAAGAENVWNGNWKFRDDTGKALSIGQLRR